MADSLVWNAYLNTSAFNAGLAQMAAGMKGAQSAAGGLASALMTIGKIAFVGLIAGITAVGAAITKTTQLAGRWEKDMARIAKVTDLEKGTQAYKEMSRDLLDIMAKMPSSQQDIMNVAATLGQLGIEQTGIPALTESILKMTSALEISGEAGATWIAKMANLNKEAVAQAGGVDQFATKLGSAVNALENVSVAKATDITDAMTDAAGSFYAWSLSPAEQAAFITTAISRGIDPGLMRTMLSSAVGGEGLYGKGRSYTDEATGEIMKSVSGLDIAGKFLGVDAKEVDRMFTEDSVNTVMAIVDAVKAKKELSPGQQQAALQKIFGGYASKEIIKLGGAQEEYARYQAIANEEMQTGTSINKEYEKSIDNLIDKGTIFKNAMKVLGIELGELFVPMGAGLFEGMASGVQGAIEWLRKMKDEGKGIKEIFSEALSIGVDKIKSKLMSIDWISAIKSAATGLIGVLGAIYSGIFNTLKEFIQGVDWQGVFESLQEAFVEVSNILMDTAKNTWDSIKKSVASINWSGAFDKIKDVSKTVFDSAKDALSGVDWKGAGTDLATKIKDGIIQVIETLKDVGDRIKSAIDQYDWSNVGQAVAKLIKDGIALAFEVAWDIGQIIWSAIGGSVDKSSSPSWFRTIADAFWEFLVGFKQEMLGDTTWQDVIFHPVRTAVELVTNFVNRYFPLLGNDIRLVAADILGTLSAWQPEFVSWFLSAFETVHIYAYNFVTEITALFKGLYQVITGTATDIQTTASTTAETVKKSSTSSGGGSSGSSGGPSSSEIAAAGASVAAASEADRKATSEKYVHSETGVTRTAGELSRMRPDQQEKFTKVSWGGQNLAAAHFANLESSGNRVKVGADGAVKVSFDEVVYPEAKLDRGMVSRGTTNLVSVAEGDPLVGAIGEIPTVISETSNKGYQTIKGIVPALGSLEAAYKANLPDKITVDVGGKQMETYAGYQPFFQPQTAETFATKESATAYWQKQFGADPDLRARLAAEDAALAQQKEQTDQLKDVKETLRGSNTIMDWTKDKVTGVMGFLKKLQDSVDGAADTVAETVSDAVEAAATTAPAPATGYFDPSTMGPDEFRANVDSLPMFYESIAGSTESYIARVKELAAEGRASPTQIAYAAKLEADQAQTAQVAQDMLGVVNTKFTETPPVMTPTENTAEVDASTQGIIADVNTATPILTVGADPTSAYLEVQSVLSWIWGSYAEITVGTNYVGGNPTAAADGSHASGLSYVPFDNYLAVLHRGERVMTAAENQRYGSYARRGGSASPSISYNPSYTISGSNAKEIETVLKKHDADLKTWMSRQYVKWSKGN